MMSGETLRIITVAFGPIVGAIVGIYGGVRLARVLNDIDKTENSKMRDDFRTETRSRLRKFDDLLARLERVIDEQTRGIEK